MLKFLILVAVLFAVAFGFHQLKDASGEVALTLGETAYAVDLTTAVIALIVVVLLTMGIIWFVQEVLYAPHRMALGWRRRNAEHGRAAISRGLIALAAGDLKTAERANQEASRRAPDLPLARLLQAQTAQLKGDREAARQVFQDMTEDPQTRIAGLRGLYIEAEREGENAAAHQIAERAREEAPSAPWAARALLRHQTVAADWDGALRTISGAADGRVLDKRTARRQRAVILTAKALDGEIGDPDAARNAALEAHELAPDLVPAAVVSGRLLSRQGDIRRATRVLEEAWKAGPHPEVAEAYLHVRAGDSAGDRLKRAEALLRLRPQADEGRLAVARAAIDARDFERARAVLIPVLTTRPTQRALMVMAELAEAETGDTGRAREWMARALRAPRDPVWTADGIILEAWAPASPSTGRLDAVEWKVPVAELEGPRLAIDAEEIRPVLIHAPEMRAEAESADEVDAVGVEPGVAPGIAVDDVPPPRPEASAAPELLQPRAPFPAEILGAGIVPEKETGNGAAPPARWVSDEAPSRPRSGPVLVADDPQLDSEPEPPLQPPLPDDPGVDEDMREEKARRFRLL